MAVRIWLYSTLSTVSTSTAMRCIMLSVSVSPSSVAINNNASIALQGLPLYRLSSSAISMSTDSRYGVFCCILIFSIRTIILLLLSVGRHPLFGWFFPHPLTNYNILVDIFTHYFVNNLIFLFIFYVAS